MGKRKVKIVLDEEQTVQVEALSAYLTVEQIADFFGFEKTTFYRICERQPEVMQRYKRGRAKAIGSVAQGLIQQARAGNLTAAMFYLKTQAGWRERERYEDDEGKAVPVAVQIVPYDESNSK